MPELKNIYNFDERLILLNGAFKVQVSEAQEQSVLLFDDLFRSGATLNAVSESLTKEGQAADVFVLAITRTRSRS